MKRAILGWREKLFEFDHEEIMQASTGIAIKSTICIARHIDIATAIGGDAGSVIPGRSPELLGPFSISSTVVFDHEEINTPSIASLESTICIARHIDIATAVGGDAGSVIPGRSPELLGPFSISSTVVFDHEEINTPSIASLESTICIARHIDIATAVGGDAVSFIPLGE